jgi:hypothetical protein
MVEDYLHRSHASMPATARTVGPKAPPRADNAGIVTEILGSAENAVYRYRIAFSDGSVDTFFGFELERVECAHPRKG